MSNSYESPTVPQATSSDGSAAAIGSLVLGLLAVVAWWIPVVALPVTIGGLICGIKGLGAQGRSAAVAGIVLSILVLNVTIVYGVLRVYMIVLGQNPFVTAS